MYVKPLTPQQFFDTALNGVVSQGYERSVSEEGNHCVYRSPLGLKCSVGHTIPDEIYNPCFDDGDGYNSISVLMEEAKDPLPSIRQPFLRPLLMLFKNVPLALLSDVQVAHDCMDLSDTWGNTILFNDEMKKIAATYNLKYSPPK